MNMEVQVLLNLHWLLELKELPGKYRGQTKRCQEKQAYKRQWIDEVYSPADARLFSTQHFCEFGLMLYHSAYAPVHIKICSDYAMWTGR